MCPAIFYISSFQWVAQASAAAFGSARSCPVHFGAYLHLMMCSIVCGSPHAHASEDANVHFFMDALQRPSPTRRRFRVFQTAQGWSWPVARCSSGMMPLSVQRVVWLPRLFHCLCHSVILAADGVVSSSAVVSKKLLLDMSRFWGAECS